MTTVDTALTRPIPRTVPFARGPVLSIAAVVGAAQLAASFGGRHHLDRGSADQPRSRRCWPR